MLLSPSKIADRGGWVRTVAKSLFHFSLAWLCLQGVWGPAVAQAKSALSSGVPLASQSTPSVAARLAVQNALFKDQFEDDMSSFPESETARGDYRDNAMLDDYSLSRQRKAKRSSITRIATSSKPFQRRGFPSRTASPTIFCFTFWIIALRTTS